MEHYRVKFRLDNTEGWIDVSARGCSESAIREALVRQSGKIYERAIILEIR